MKDEITKIILRIAEEQNPTLPTPVDLAKGAEAGLYGPGGALDSLALVRFIVEIESAVEDKFGVSVILASERAMSQRRSPFLSVGALAEYIEQIVTEAGPAQT